MVILTDFYHLRPRHELDQEHILEMIAVAHGEAEGSTELRDQIRERLSKLGVGKERIANRGAHNLDLSARGFGELSTFYDREISEVFEKFYPEGAALPEHLIHVTCTGYVAPSPAQKLISRRKGSTVVTHAYHMGCYASMPAVRIAQGFGTDTHIVHTELCSLHHHPRRHTTDQLIVQSLFADGFIRYRAATQATHGLRLVALREELIPNSTGAMTWRCEEHGMGMTLAKEVPVLISRTLPSYLQRLGAPIEGALFAVHCGGPKILDQVQKLLKLEPDQLRHSTQVLREFGNMSSATLPHIWEKMVNDPTVAPGTPIVSMAFGPGLIISGGLFEKL